jgi:3-oxocholest-4-en-26-oate---CoA ligase
MDSAMPGWNFAATWDTIAMVLPDREAVICGDQRVTWGEFADRARRLSWYLESNARLEPGDKVAICLTNRPEYLETFFAALLLGCIPVNVSFRSTADEVHGVLDHSDAKVVVVGPDQASTVARACKRMQKPWRPRLLAVGVPYERAIASATPPDHPRREPSPDDLVLLYAVGTAGMSMGAMWRNEDLYLGVWAASHPDRPEPPDPITAALSGGRTGSVLPVAPLANGAGLFVSLATLAGAGTVVLIDRPGLDAQLVWDTVERERVETVTLVGDAAARSLLAALDANPRRWDVSSLRSITSSGARFSPETRRAVLAHLVPVAIVDTVGPPDALGSRDRTRAVDDAIAPAPYRTSSRIRVVDERTGRDVTPGSGEVGRLAIGGFLPVGYYKDPQKTRATFKLLDGTRYSIPGDFATVDADGNVHLLGRGSALIDAGAEKLHPEEVERALRGHASVFDCAVVGVPDARFGEQVVALVQVTQGHYLDEAELAMWCRARLVSAKTPRRFLFVDTIERSGAEVASRERLRVEAMARLREA